jgi:multidrug efflux pump subunit AcrA (membrane-fusion protein)
MRCRLLLVFWSAVLLCCGSLTVQGQSSTPISLPPVNPFAQPLFLSTLLLSQINSLASDTLKLQQTINDLQDSSLLQQQALDEAQQTSQALQASLDQSEATRVAQEQQLKASTISLQSSQVDLGKAQADAKALEAENGILKIGFVTIAVVGAGEAVYLVGHSLKAW